MKHAKTRRLAGLLCATLLFGISGRLCAQTLNWGSLTGSLIVDSHGDPIPADDSYMFQLGTFNDDYIFGDEPAFEWVDSFNALDIANYSSSPSGGQYFTSTVQLHEIPYSTYQSLFEGRQAYLVITNLERTELFVASAAHWLFPVVNPADCCPNDPPLYWSVSDFGHDTPDWGSQDGHEGPGAHTPPPTVPDIQTHAVPEPGSALLLLAAVGWGVARRRRQGSR